MALSRLGVDLALTSRRLQSVNRDERTIAGALDLGGEALQMADVSGDTDGRRAADAQAEPAISEAVYGARSPSPGAFDQALRHSARVRFLRWAIVGVFGAATAVMLAIGLFGHFLRRPDESAGQIRIEGERIILASTKISGFLDQQHPYQVKARAGVVNMASPNLSELSDVDAIIGSDDHSGLHVTAEHASYDSLQDHLIMDRSVQIRNGVGDSISVKTAQMDFRTGALISRAPVSVTLTGGSIAANQMDIEETGRISFEGKVRSIIESGQKEQTATGEPVGE
jgi:lipopolysaccharide export system protein LptC